MTKTKKVTVSTTTGNLRRMRRYGRKKRYNDPWSTEIHKYKRTTFNEIDVSASNALHLLIQGSHLQIILVWISYRIIQNSQRCMICIV